MSVNFEVALNKSQFDSLNQNVFEIQNLVASSAAAVLIIQNGVVVNEWYSGRHDHSEHSRKVDAKSQFNIGSIRKTYLGFAISLALQEGRIKSLDDFMAQP